MYITFLLLDLIVKNPTTADILLSVVNPHKSLIVAFIMGAFVIYIYTFFIFVFMPYRIIADDDMTPGGMDGLDCITLWGCYKYVFAYGFRAGGGVGEVMFADVGNAVWLHLTFFLVVTVAMLNIIFGIIIDTFSGLRSDKNVRAYDTTETCFVCSLGRQVFDRAANSPDGFKDHIKNDHHMWNYLYFIFFLWEQDKDDDDGLEYYVRHKIIQNEITWFPMSQAMCLDMGATDHEVMREDLMKQITSKEHDLVKRVGDMEEKVSSVLDKLSGAIERDYSDAPSIKLGIADYLKKLDEGELNDDEIPALLRMGSSLEQASAVGDSASAGLGDSSVLNQLGSALPLCVVMSSVSLPPADTKDLQQTTITFTTPLGETFSQEVGEIDGNTVIFDSPLTLKLSNGSSGEDDSSQLSVGVFNGQLNVTSFTVPMPAIVEKLESENLIYPFKVGVFECSAKFSCMRLDM